MLVGAEQGACAFLLKNNPANAGQFKPNLYKGGRRLKGSFREPTYILKD
jgi:hypothetical protein